ncbi:zinc finger MYM-type protein 2-like isoform X2 [Halichondria panicea]|uniref:zinc finger MYM-type protein 2-like isoform X2 n=1 Tax=Halichondria panicea TaxID=6063 RepID=UPI00312B3A39
MNMEDEFNKCPEDLLVKMDPEQLNHWLSIFIVETRKVTGEPYPPTTIHSILSGILRYMRSLDAKKCPNFFAKKDPRFQTFHNTMDSVFRELRKQGVGSDKKHAKAFSKEEENQLWSSGAIGSNDPLALLRAVFYYNGKCFCLRGGVEHRDLRLSQLRREKDGYTYTENSSKNRAGGIAQLKLDNKSVFIAEVPEAGERCHCKLLDKYISKLPQEAIDADLFYLQPLRKVVTDSQKWYSSVPVGKNMLYKMVNTICAQGGIELKSNHSLRATGATELYNAGVPEKIIKERTGHRSLESLRMYERTSDKQHHAVSRILSSDRETSFNAEINKTTSTHLNSSHGQPVLNFSNCQVTIAYNQGNVTGSTMSSTQQAL